jgi:hypothetical protein
VGQRQSRSLRTWLTLLTLHVYALVSCAAADVTFEPRRCELSEAPVADKGSFQRACRAQLRQHLCRGNAHLCAHSIVVSRAWRTMSASVTARRTADAARPRAAWTSKLSSLGSVGGAKPLVAFIRTGRPNVKHRNARPWGRTEARIACGRPSRSQQFLNDQNRSLDISQPRLFTRETACPCGG